jgi:phenylacetate-CoA ligase
MRDGTRLRHELDSIVYDRLRNVLISAFLHVPYYRDVMNSVGYDPSRDYSGPGDLSLLPITRQDALKKMDPARLVQEGRNLDDYFSVTTAGSTGDPLRVYVTPEEATLRIAKWLRVLFLNGYSIFDKVMSLKVPDRFDNMGSTIQRFGVLRRLQGSSVNPPEKIVDLFMSYGPQVLYGSRSALELMALELRRRGRRPRALKVLLQHGELLHNGSKRLCKEQFGAEIINSYGSVEMGVMAYETPAQKRLRLCEDLTYFEFLDEKGIPVSPGQPGRVVVTNLTSTLMPFIRYDQGDLVVFEETEDMAGKSARRITRILGRREDHIVFADGTTEPYTTLYAMMDPYEGIEQYRVVQETPDTWHLFVVADGNYLHGIQDELLQDLKRRFPRIVSCKISSSNCLEIDASGKIKAFVSKVF